MSSTNKNGRGGGGKRKDGKIADKFKAVCPPHRLPDLEPLVKAMKGDEEKIRAAIDEWWDEPKEPEWEDVNKKSSRRNQQVRQYRRDTGRSGFRAPGGRGFYGRGMSGGRGAGPERRREHGEEKPVNKKSERKEVTGERKEGNLGPAPVMNVRRPAGAWGQTPTPPPAATVPSPPTAEKPKPKSPEVGLVSAQDPTPAGFIDTKKLSEPLPLSSSNPPLSPPPISAPPPVVSITGNVWADKGSGHLFEAEKPKPRPVEKRRLTRPRKPVAPAPVAPLHEPTSPVVTEPPATVIVEESEIVITPSPEIPPPVEELEGDGGEVNDFSGGSALGTGWETSSPPVSSLVPEVEASPIMAPLPTPTLDIEEPPVEEEELEISIPVPLEEEESLEEEKSFEEEGSEEPVKKGGVLNLGRWELHENDDSESLDFGFGAFAHECDDVAPAAPSPVEEEDIDEVPPPVTQDDIVSPSPVSMPNQTLPSGNMDTPLSSSSSLSNKPIPSSIPPIVDSNSSSVSSSQPPMSDIAATSVSPARPPPGLSISGMPPMPANAVLVHELENKLESASLNPPAEDKPVEPASAPPAAPPSNETPLDTKKDLTVSQHPSQQPPSVVTSYPETTPIVPSGMSNYTYGMNMYNYNPSNVGNGFVGIHTPAGPVIAGGVLPQQKITPTPNTSQPQPNPNVHPQQQNSLYGAPASSNINQSDNNLSSNTDQNTLPPGMPAMQYNPALFNYPQYPQMGQPHGGVGYGYPYNQFQQGGFAYQPMAQNGAYPQSYDDHHQNSHSSHSSSYQKSHQGGRYRGGNSHHHGGGSHQYQNQNYAPHNYGGQPYNMNYMDVHRGGYPQVDPNMYNSAYQSNQNFDQEDLQPNPHQKKKVSRGSNGGFGNPPPFQGPGGPQGNQGFGFPTGERSEGSTGGWSNQSWVAPSWQGN